MPHKRITRDSNTLGSCLENIVHDSEGSERKQLILETVRAVVGALLEDQKSFVERSLNERLQTLIRLRVSMFVAKMIKRKRSILAIKLESLRILSKEINELITSNTADEGPIPNAPRSPIVSRLAA